MAPKREPSTPPHRRDPFDGDFSDERRAKAVKSDAGRKRAALKYSNRGEVVPPSYFRRELEEFDLLRAEREARRCHQRLNGEGSSNGGSNTSTALALLPLVNEYDPADFESAVATEDFVPEDAFDAITTQVLLRSVWEAEEKATQAAREEEIDEILLRQGLEVDVVATEKAAYWTAYAAEVIDLVSDDE